MRVRELVKNLQQLGEDLGDMIELAGCKAPVKGVVPIAGKGAVFLLDYAGEEKKARKKQRRRMTFDTARMGRNISLRVCEISPSNTTRKTGLRIGEGE